MKNNEEAMNFLLDLVDKSIAKYLNKLSSAYDMWNFLDIKEENTRIDDSKCLNLVSSVDCCSSEETDTSSIEENEESDFTCMETSSDEESEEMMDAILSGYSIGTPATRAETIKKLKFVGYIANQIKNLI